MMRYLLTWEEIKQSAKGERDIDLASDVGSFYRAFPDRESAVSSGNEILASGVTFFGCVSVQKQVWDDADWHNVGQAEEISDFPANAVRIWRK